MTPEDWPDVRSVDWCQQVLDTAPDGIVIVGADEKIQFVNEQTEGFSVTYDRICPD